MFCELLSKHLYGYIATSPKKTLFFLPPGGEVDSLEADQAVQPLSLADIISLLPRAFTVIVLKEDQ